MRNANPDCVFRLRPGGERERPRSGRFGSSHSARRAGPEPQGSSRRPIVDNLKLSERLEDRVIEILESEGAGPETLGALQRLRDDSRLRLPQRRASAII